MLTVVKNSSYTKQPDIHLILKLTSNKTIFTDDLQNNQVDINMVKCLFRHSVMTKNT